MVADVILQKIKWKIAGMGEIFPTLFCVLRTKLSSRIANFEPPVYFDVGARSGVRQPWRTLARFGLVKAFGFEPDEAECARLNRKFRWIKVFPFALGDCSGTATLYMTRNPGCASLLKPNMKALLDEPVGSWFEVEESVGITTITMADAVDLNDLPSPDYIKLDVQGYEFKVLKGAEGLLENTLCLELETHFKEIYQDETLFWDIKEYLESLGFRLVLIRPSGMFVHEMMEADCFFVRYSPDLSVEQKAKIDFWKWINRVPKPPRVYRAEAAKPLRT